MERARENMSLQNKNNEMINKVYDTLRLCAVADDPEQARIILHQLFNFNDIHDMEMVKYLMIELCISVFHGLNSPSSVPKIDEPFQPASERQSKLGTLDLPPLSSVIDPENTVPYKYDSRSDDSDTDNYTTYSNDDNNSLKYQSTGEQWAQALNHDKQQTPEHQVTCEDLFHALATNLSSVVLPKVSVVNSTLSRSSSTASVVSTSPSVPSYIPYSMNSESLNSSPTNDYHIIDHHSLEGGDESALRSLSNNGEDDVSSIDTIDAAHDQSHPSQYKNLPDEVGILSTPPTARSNRDCPKTKGKSTSRKIVHIRGPTRLRNMIENAVKTVIQECEFENSSTPQKHSTSSSKKVNEGSPLRLTNPILKRITRSVSIELSLELSTSSYNASDHLNYGPLSDRSQQASPAARDLSTILWPAISGFVGTEATPEMIGVFVDLIEADVIEKKIFPDLYIHQIEEIIDQDKAYLIDEEEYEIEDSEMNNRGTQNDIISQYVHAIDNYEEKSANLQSFNKKGKRGHQSASRQILDLDGDFDEETSEYARSVMEGTSKSTPVKSHTAPWDTPVSPMDEIFRQTVGALGSNKKLPFIPDSDMNDSSTNASDENPSTPTFSNLKQSEMDIYRGLDDSDYESNSLNLHEDTEFVDSYQEAEKKIFGIQPSHSSSEDSVSDAPDSSLRPQIDTEESYADEDYISISDLPPDFGIPSEDTKTSHHLYNGVYHNEPPLSEEDLESLEKQMEQLNNSQSSRLFSQPSIAEIIVGEADNLVVLPRGESPVSSPEARLMSNSRKVDFFSEGSPKYTNNVPDTSSESEDESENQETLSDHISEPATNLADNIQIDTLLSEDTDEIISNRQNWMYSGNNPHIPPSPFIDEGFKNQIPYPKLMSPSSNIDFQAISRRRSKEKPKENDDESEPEEEEEEQEEEEEEIEPRKLDQSLLIPSPQRPHNSQVSLSAGNSRNKENFYEEESSSEEGEEDDKVHGYPTHSGTQESSNKTMTSDDEREEDQRLFDAIMNEKPKKIITNTIPVPLTVSSEIPPPAPTEEEIQEYYAEMMRCALKGFNPSNIDNIPMKSYDDIPNHSSSSSGDDDDPNRSLQEISTNAIQNMDQHFHEIFSRHNLTSTLAEEILDEIELKEYNYHQKKQRKNKKKDVNIIQKMELEMPCTSTSSVMSPDEYYKESTPSSAPSTSTSVIKSKEYNKILNNLTRNYQHGTSKPNNQSHTAAADILPVTQNQELNKMFTQSFRDLVSYYQPQQSDHHGDTSNSGNNPEDQIGIHEKKLKKKETNRKSSTPTTSTRKSRSPNPRNIELNLEEGQENKKEKLSKKQLKEKKNEKLVSSSSSSLSSPSWQNKKDIIPSSSSSQSHLPLPLQGVEQVVITPSLENSKYLHGNTVSSGRIVYGIHNDGPIMSQEWNNTNNKPSHRLVQRSTIPSSSSSAPSSPIKKDPPPGATSGTTSAKRRSQSPDLSKKKKGMKGNNESDYPVKDDSIVPKRSSSARSSRKSSTTTSTSTSKFQHLTAPTFSSVIRSLNIAGIDYNDIQAITQASKDANYFVSSHHSDLSHPSYTDSYYTSGIDIITALATNGNQKKKMKQNKSKQK